MTIAVENQKNIMIIPLLPSLCSVKINGHSLSAHSMLSIKMRDVQPIVCMLDDTRHCEWAVMVMVNEA